MHLRAGVGSTKGDRGFFGYYFVLIWLVTRCWLSFSWPVILLENKLRIYCFPSIAVAPWPSSAAAGERQGHAVHLQVGDAFPHWRSWVPQLSGPVLRTQMAEINGETSREAAAPLQRGVSPRAARNRRLPGKELPQQQLPLCPRAGGFGRWFVTLPVRSSTFLPALGWCCAVI